MAVKRVISENTFEENVIHTYKHFLNKSRGYFQGELFDAIQEELEALTRYEDDAITHAYNYYDSKLQHKINLFAKIGATELESAFLFEQSALKLEIEKLPAPAKRSGKEIADDIVGMIKQIGKESGMDKPKPKTTTKPSEVEVDLIYHPDKLYEVEIDGKKEIWSYEYLQRMISDNYELELSKPEMQQYYDKSIKKKQGLSLIDYAEDLGYKYESDDNKWIPNVVYKVDILDEGEEVKGKKLFTTRSGAKITMVTAIPFDPNVAYTHIDEKTKNTETKSFNERMGELEERHPEVYGEPSIEIPPTPPTPEVPTDLYWVVKDKNMGYAGKNIQNNLPFFEFKTNPENADRYTSKEDAEDVAIMLDEYFKNGSFYAIQEELPMMARGGGMKRKKIMNGFEYFKTKKEFETTLNKLWGNRKSEWKVDESDGETNYSIGLVNIGGWMPSRPKTISGLPAGAVNTDVYMTDKDIVYPSGSYMD